MSCNLPKKVSSFFGKNQNLESFLSTCIGTKNLKKYGFRVTFNALSNDVLVIVKELLVVEIGTLKKIDY